jgi:hypothetical protein
MVRSETRRAVQSAGCPIALRDVWSRMITHNLEVTESIYVQLIHPPHTTRTTPNEERDGIKAGNTGANDVWHIKLYLRLLLWLKTDDGDIATRVLLPPFTSFTFGVRLDKRPTWLAHTVPT